MTQKQLITIEQIRQFRPASKSIPADRITPYIYEAQQHDLKPLLGDALYYDFMTRYDQSADPKYSAYQDLLNGVAYQYGNITIEHPGLTAFLVYFTLSHFYVNNQVNVTPFGLTTKKTDESDPVDAKMMANAIAELRAIALSYQADIVKFLTTKGAVYPLYNYQDGSALGNVSVKFFDPDDNRNPGNGRTLTSL
jgi:hypothetical protein